jgi:hypothetical protein
MKIFIFLLAAILTTAFFSCAGDNDKVTDKQTQQKSNDDVETESTVDANLTPEEAFSASILIDYLGDSDDEDLAEYLENEIYKMGSNFNGISVVEATPSTWLVMLEKDTLSKNYLLQKFLNLKTNENYFKMQETKLTVTDLITKPKEKISMRE